MGHLTLISEDVIGALEHFPPDLRLIIVEFAPTPGWDEYVTGRYNETKKRDTCLLGGGKPVIAAGGLRNAARWKVDEADSLNSPAADGPERSFSTNGNSEFRSEFRRAGSLRPVRESSADFGPASMDQDDDHDTSPPQVSFPITPLLRTPYL
jgi:serine/threonine-protein phosphatase 6 regulatory subunit 3